MTQQGNGNTGLAIRQEGFGGMSTQGVGETSALAIAAQAKAAVEARWIVAMRQRRDVDQVRGEILRECKRPAFAEVARYLKPIGDGVTGPSIRFVEAALQAYGNCDTEAITIYDDADKRIVEVRVTDFERNVTHRKQITVTKVVERKFLRKGQTAIGTRTNSYGDTIYMVAASDDDLLNKEGALVSKAVRTCGLRLLPGWLVEECMAAVVKTQNTQAARDPDAERKRVADAFMEVNVQPADLSKYLGHDLGKVSPAELTELRQVFATIRDGQASWPDILAHRLEQRGEEAPAAPKEDSKPAPAPQRGTQAAMAAMGKAAAAKATPAAQAPQEPAQEEEPPPPAEEPPPVRKRKPKPQAAPKGGKAKPAARKRKAKPAAPPPPPQPEPEIPEDEKRMASIEAAAAEPEPEPQGEFDPDTDNAIDAEYTEDGEAYDADTGEVLEDGEEWEEEPEGQEEAAPEEPEEEDEFQEPDWMRGPTPPRGGGTPPQGEGF